MPYVSKAQEKYFNAHRAELEHKGVDVAEWNNASKGLPLPERAGDHDRKSRGGKAGRRYREGLA